MVISADKAQTAIMQYLENEIARKATGLQKFASYFIIGSMSGKVDKIISKLQDNEVIKMLGLFDENGNIKLDEVYAAAKQAMNKSGTVTIYGVTFNSEDVETLYNYMRS